jgi:hypothetical protein
MEGSWWIDLAFHSHAALQHGSKYRQRQRDCKRFLLRRSKLGVSIYPPMKISVFGN